MQKRFTRIVFVLLIVLAAGTLSYYWLQPPVIEAPAPNIVLAEASHEIVQPLEVPCPVVVAEVIAPKVAPPQPRKKQISPPRQVKRFADYDRTAAVVAFNQDTTLAFSKGFRSIEVAPTVLTKYRKRIKNGYAITLKNNTPVSTPTIIGEKIYVSGGFGTKKFYCFDFIDGKLNWAVHLGDDGPSSAVYNDSLVIFNTESCTIFALNRFTGKLKWSYWLGDPLLSAPALAGNQVFTAYPNSLMFGNPAVDEAYPGIKPSHPFVCMDANSGKIRWQKWLDGDVLNCPVVVGDHVYLTTMPGTVYKMDRKDGTVRAAVALGATSVPSVTEGKIYLTRRADEGKVVREAIAVLDRENLALLQEMNAVEAPYLDYDVQKKSQWASFADQLDVGNGFPNAPVTSGWQAASENIGQASVSSMQLFQPSTVLVRGSKIYCLMGDALYCLNPKTEKILWQYDLPGDMYKQGGALATTPILAGEHLVTVTTQGKLLVLNRHSGAVAYTRDTRQQVRSAPVVRDGIVLMPTAKGRLYSLDTGIESLDGWSTAMKNPAHDINH